MEESSDFLKCPSSCQDLPTLPVCVCACMYGAGSLGVERSREMTGSDLKVYPGLGRAYINIQLQLCTSYQYIGGARSLKCYLKDEQQLAR